MHPCSCASCYVYLSSSVLISLPICMCDNLYSIVIICIVLRASIHLYKIIMWVGHDSNIFNFHYTILREMGVYVYIFFFILSESSLQSFCFLKSFIKINK